MTKKKGIKDRKDIVQLTDEDALALVKQRAVKIHNSPTLVKLAAADREYLRGMWQVFRDNMPKPGLAEYNTKAYRYQPYQMWENIKKYFDVTIEHGQPLTVSGMALFCGIPTKNILHGDMVKDGFAFLVDCKRFIEMYNEYAAHKKMNPAGPIFILKNFGWQDKFEIEASSTMGALTEAERQEAQRRIASFTEVQLHGNEAVPDAVPGDTEEGGPEGN
jgi:hypothetical protein